jgi:hypothetical protein
MTESHHDSRQTPKPQRRTLYLMLALFFVPLVASFTLYFGVGWRPSGGTNHGQLLQPIRQLPAAFDALRGQWALAYVGDSACDDACRHALYIGRQTHTLLNKDMDRVQRVLLATDHCCAREFLDAEHAGILTIAVNGEALGQLQAVLPPGDHTTHLFVIDPMGNLVLRFDTSQNPKGLLDDLKKLLKLSHIG